MRLRTLPKQMGTTSAKAGLRSITADDQELLPANASLFDCGRWPLRQIQRRSSGAVIRKWRDLST